jgi:hypothetical protein
VDVLAVNVEKEKDVDVDVDVDVEGDCQVQPHELWKSEMVVLSMLSGFALEEFS